MVPKAEISSTKCSTCEAEVRVEAIECLNCHSLTLAGYELQASFLDRLRGQVAALNDEFGEHRKALAQTIARFFKIVNDLEKEASELQLDKMQRKLQRLSRDESENRTGIDSDSPAGVDEYGLFLFAAALRRIEGASQRQAMHRSGASLQDLQQDIFLRGRAELRRFEEMLTGALRGEPSGEQLGLFRETMGKLSWEAEVLEMPASFRHTLSNLSIVPSGERLNALLRLFNPHLGSQS